MDVKGAVRNNYKLDDPNLGWCVRDDVEGNVNTWGTFYSSDSGVTGSLPVLSITYTTIADKYTVGPYWSASVVDDLHACVVNYSSPDPEFIVVDPDPYFGNRINASYQRWNNICALSIDSINRVSTPDAAASYEIQIWGSNSLPDSYAAATTWEGTTYRDWSIIYLNTKSGLPMRTINHDWFQEEIIVHELGHAAGLDDTYEKEGDGRTYYDRTRCIMSGIGPYGYPHPTSHDQQTLDLLY
jgi:hypothetical protein